jgi:hypothetical protein
MIPSSHIQILAGGFATVVMSLVVSSQVDGDWRYDSRGSALIWTIDLIDNTNRSGSLEFVVPACDPEVFYPVEVRGHGRGGG